MTEPVLVASDEMTVTVTVDEVHAWVCVTGEVDACAAPRLASVLREALAGPVCEVTVALQDVTFLDSSGVSAVVAAYRHGRTLGVPLRVSAASRAARRPLQLTGVWALVASDPDGTGADHAV